MPETAESKPGPVQPPKEEDRFRIVIDVDGTLCFDREEGQSYADVTPNAEVIEKLKEYRQKGFYIIVQSARQMRTYRNNVGLVNANTLPVLMDWLQKHEVPFDEVHMGKPWCGFKGFYVDDKAIRPDEFVNLSYEEVCERINVGGV